MVLKTPLHPGGVAVLGLDRDPARGRSGGRQAGRRRRAPSPGTSSGVVWRDFKPGGGTPGKVEPGELGLPGVTVQLRNSEDKVVKTAAAADDGSFDFGVIAPGTYHAAISAQTFAKPWGGFAWLGTKLITPSLMIAYIWIWAGFAMVVIARGARGDAARRPRGGAHRRRDRVAGLPARHRARCSRRCSRSSSSR